MLTNWIAELEDVENRNNYHIRFYQGKDLPVNARTASKIKFAIMNDVKFFSIKDSMYATASVAAIIKMKKPCRIISDIEYNELDPPKEQIEARNKYYSRLSMDSYMSNDGKLLETPKDRKDPKKSKLKFLN